MHFLKWLVDNLVCLLFTVVQIACTGLIGVDQSFWSLIRSFDESGEMEPICGPKTQNNGLKDTKKLCLADKAFFLSWLTTFQLHIILFFPTQQSGSIQFIPLTIRTVSLFMIVIKSYGWYQKHHSLLSCFFHYPSVKAPSTLIRH